jgi:acetyltransferase-like isoleucine patch superfamily enzyme
MEGEVYVHPLALNESRTVGAGTRIWAFAHVMKGAVIGRDCNLGDHVFVEAGAVIGDGVTIKNGVCVWEGVTLEDHVFVGPLVAFTNDRHPRSPRGPAARGRYADKASWLVPTRLREGAAVGANATILCGITVGRYATVAAGAVVTRDVRDFRLVAGCPAREMGYVCMCGHSLGSEPPFACPACGRRYEEEAGSLRLAGGA